MALGDRWNGSVTIDGDLVTAVSEPGTPTNTTGNAVTTSFEAKRP